METKTKKKPAAPRKEKSKRGVVVSGERKKRPLTMKQKKLIKGISEGKTQRVAAIEAGYSPKSAESIASQELAKTQVKATLQELMEKHGLDDASILKVHAEMIKANKGDEPDWTARGKGVEMAYKLKGSFTEKIELTDNRDLAERIKAARGRVNVEG